MSEFSVCEDEPVLDTTVPNITRVYNFRLGGKAHFAADRAEGAPSPDITAALARGSILVAVARKPLT